jgi:hypothetical protein
MKNKKKKDQDVSTPFGDTQSQLSVLLEGLKETKRQQKEEFSALAEETIPKLGDFFSLLAGKKVPTVVKEVVAEAVAEVPFVDEPMAEQIQVVEQAIEEVTQVVEQIQAVEATPVPVDQQPALRLLKQSISALEARLVTEVNQLRKMVQIASKAAANAGGGGEVLFRRLDDVAVGSLVNGDFLVWDETTKRFVNKTVFIGVPGGLANQVLIKKSDTDFDYEWTDMVTTQQEFTKLIDDTNPLITYIGEANPTTPPTASTWRIRRITYDANLNVDSVEFAGTGTFTHSWVNRATLSYS